MAQANDFDSTTLGQMSALLVAHAELVSETSEAMALDIAASLEELQAELKDTSLGQSVQKNLTKMLAALQNQDKLRQQMMVVTRGLELVSDARLPDGVSPEAWYSNGLTEIQKRYVMREQTQLHDAFFNGGEKADAVEDEIEFF